MICLNLLMLATIVNPITHDTALEQRISAILPKPSEERWLTIPWEPNLLKARALAQKNKKPIFLWIMNGNPLGCT